MTQPTPVAPDTKDWTWVLDRPCPECGFVADEVTVDRIPPVIRDNATEWEAALTRADVRERPAAQVWSVLEYACHVRDVHRVFAERVRLMLEHDEPRFANWDQDEAALTGRYVEQDPEVVAGELIDAAAAVADLYEDVPPGAWSRRGFRSNGSVFTIESLGRYHLHDLVHHVHDIAAPSGTAAES